MAVASADYAAWLEQADIPPSRLTTQLDALLQAVFRFRHSQGTDYYSTRLLSHFLLHCETGLKVAQIARLLGISRPNASLQQNLSSKEAIKQAHHRMDGRPTGKLLPRYAGPIAGYLLSHPGASRADVLDFIKRTFGVQVSRIALYKFLKKYGLQDVPDPAPAPAETSATSNSGPAPAPTEPTAATGGRTAAPVSPCGTQTAPPPAPSFVAPSLELIIPGPLAAPAPVIELARAIEPGKPSAPPFCSDGRNMPAPSCCWAKPSTG
jgi:hypothetical protein